MDFAFPAKNLNIKEVLPFAEKTYSLDNTPLILGDEGFNASFIFYSFLLSESIIFERNKTFISNEEKIDIIFELLTLDPIWILSDKKYQTVLNPVPNRISLGKYYPDVSFSPHSKFAILLKIDHDICFLHFDNFKLITLKNESIVNFIEDNNISIKKYQKIPSQKKLELENALNSNFTCENGYEKFYDQNYGYTWDCRWIFSKEESLENIKKIYFIYQLPDYNEELISILYDKIVL